MFERAPSQLLCNCSLLLSTTWLMFIVRLILPFNMLCVNLKILSNSNSAEYLSKVYCGPVLCTTVQQNSWFVDQKTYCKLLSTNNGHYAQLCCCSEMVCIPWMSIMLAMERDKSCTHTVGGGTGYQRWALPIEFWYSDCAADFSLLNLPKGKSLGRSKPATNS